VNFQTRDPDRLKRLLRLFNIAAEMPADERNRYIAVQAGEDRTLRIELERLIARDLRLRDSKTLSALDSLAFSFGDEDVLFDERDWRGETLGRYTLDEEIGRGGMGRVYAARRVDGEFEQEVAVKLVNRSAMNPALLRRFSNERRVLAALDHPGICRLLDAGSADDGTPWVAMERVRGLCITAWCDEKKLDFAARLQLFRQVINACAHAHQNLVVHRDLKPSNILVSESGQAKLLDFGIAKPLAVGNEYTTGTAERMFTLSHAAPEQWRGEPSTVGCDVYALGVLLYELLAGSPPFRFDGLLPGQIERLILHTPPEALNRRAASMTPSMVAARGFSSAARLGAALRGDLDAIVERALRKGVGERYATVEQLDADVAAYLEERPVSARGGQRWYRVRKFVARHSYALAAVAAGCIAALALGIVILLQTLEVRRERDLAAQAIAFLKDAFYAADPARSAGADLSARQVMVAARADLDGLRISQPRLYATLAAVIADVELGLGLSENAAGLAAQALASGAADEAEVQSLLLLKARADMQGDRLEPAELAIGEYLARGGDESAELRVVRGSLAVYARRYVDAAADFEAAIKGRRGDADADPWLFRARLELAYLQRLRGEDEDALATLDSLLADQSTRHSAGHPNLTRVRLRRVDVLRRLGRDEAAVSEARRAVEAIIQSYGREVPVYAAALNTLANALDSAGQASRAVPVLEEALQLYRGQLGPEHGTTLRTQYNLALSLAQSTPDDPRSDQLFSEVVEVGSRVFGENGQTLAFFRAGMADSLLARRRAPQALEQLLAIPRSLLDDAPPSVLALLSRAHTEACPSSARVQGACRIAADVLQANSRKP
jgi:serine/threonine-protein kinase